MNPKLIEMTHLNEMLYCCGIACSAECKPTETGAYIIDMLLANVCKQNARGSRMRSAGLQRILQAA